MKKTILFLSTHNLSTNPRLLKEIRLALDNQFKVEVICFEFNNWSKQLNDDLLAEYKNKGVVFYVVPAGRENLFNWLWSVAKEKLSRGLAKVFRNENMLANAVSRRSSLIISALQYVKAKPLMVIGHNPGALYATKIAAQKFNCKAGFDVEDYHPGEGHDIYLQNLCRQLMKRMLPKMDYVSFASPLIQESVEKDCNGGQSNWFTVMNYFAADEFSAPVSIIEGPVKMVWFSQNINRGRGLELVLPAIKKLNGLVELHLFGNAVETFYETELKLIPNLFVHLPLPQRELHQNLAAFDIGLALEPAKDRNNEMAVSNKMLAYLQSGLFVLASNTGAQENLISAFPEHGYCFDYKKNDSETALQQIIEQIEFIREKRQWRYNQFLQHNWETASLQLLESWAT